MSRYDLVSRDDNLTVAAGWDGPLDTFFFQVFKIDIEDDQPEMPTAAVGQTHGECQNVDSFLTLLASHAEIPGSLRDRLRVDQATEPHDPESAGTQFARALRQAQQA